MTTTPHTTALARRDTALTDEEMRALDHTARQFYRRVLELVNATGCSIALALQAVAASTQEATQ